MMKAIKIDDSGSVLVQSGNLKVWVDVWKDDSGETVADWNKYIFFTDNEDDMRIKKFQENVWNFEQATSVAITYYEFKTGEL